MPFSIKGSPEEAANVIAMGKTSFRTTPLLVLAAASSLAPWLFAFAIFLNATDEALEGAAFLAAVVGALSFAATGPLTIIALTAQSQRARISRLAFAVLYAAICLPTIGFQLGPSVSIMPLFIPGDPWHMSDTVRQVTYAGIAACVWYVIYFFVLSSIAQYATRWTVVAAIGAAFCSFAIIVEHVLHP